MAKNPPARNKAGEIITCKICNKWMKRQWIPPNGYYTVHWKISDARACKRMRAAIDAGYVKAPQRD